MKSVASLIYNAHSLPKVLYVSLHRKESMKIILVNRTIRLSSADFPLLAASCIDCPNLRRQQILPFLRKQDVLGSPCSKRYCKCNTANVNYDVWYLLNKEMTGGQKNIQCSPAHGKNTGAPGPWSSCLFRGNVELLCGRSFILLTYPLCRSRFRQESAPTWGRLRESNATPRSARSGSLASGLR